MEGDDKNTFLLALDSFLKVNLQGDAFLCLEWLLERIKFLIMKMKAPKPSGLSFETSETGFRTKFLIVRQSQELISKMQFSLENNIYIYQGSQEFLNFVSITIEKEVNKLREKIGRTPRMPLLGPKTLNRAFYPFEGSARYMVGFIESQGSRPTMEDEIVVCGTGPRMRENEDYFAVFDGHGGPEASAFAAKHLHDILDSNLGNYEGYAKGEQLSDQTIIDAFLATFKELDTSMCVQYGMQAGACALVTYFSGDRLFTANLGDSRAVMGTRQGTVRITNDHKPLNRDEYDRITSLEGGFVSTDNPPARVQGQLSVSRALGDRHLKPYVSGEPDIYCTHLTDDHYFIIMGCDGVWDKITDELAVQLTMKTNNPQEAASNIFKKIKGKSDNISIVVIFLRHPKYWTQFEPKKPALSIASMLQPCVVASHSDSSLQFQSKVSTL